MQYSRTIEEKLKREIKAKQEKKERLEAQRAKKKQRKAAQRANADAGRSGAQTKREKTTVKRTERENTQAVNQTIRAAGEQRRSAPQEEEVAPLRRRKKKSTEQTDAEGGEPAARAAADTQPTEAEPEQPAPKRRARKKATAAEAAIEATADTQPAEAEPEQPAPKRRCARKKAEAAEPAAEATADTQPAEAEPEQPAPKRRARQKRPGPALLTGVYTSNARGFGFVTVEGLEQDLFIPPSKSGGAFCGDTVEVEAEPAFREADAKRNAGTAGKAGIGGGRGASGGAHREASVVRIVQRAVTSLVGTYQKEKGFGFVHPDNPKIPVDIHVYRENSQKAVTGHKVVVQITDYGSAKRRPEGVVTEILGHIDDPSVDILSIIRAFDLPEAFPSEVTAQVAAMDTEKVAEASTKTRAAVKKAAGRQETAGVADTTTGGEEAAVADRANGLAAVNPLREDLRDVLMVTIDGEDAKDLDDAVSLVKRGKEWELGVHIADVSEYVREGTPLDQEALRRGTSVYLVDRVIPMLPHELSNGICSLNQGEDRYALSCLMRLNKQGEVIDHRITESLIRTDARLSYNGVKRVLETGDTAEIEEALRSRKLRGTKTRTERIARMLRNMARLAAVLHEKRAARGAIDFDFPESKILLDENGRPVDIFPYEHNEATNLIEDFMLLANETVAEHCCRLELPFVYRVHGAPDEQKILQLAAFVKKYGFSLKHKRGQVHPNQIRRLLEKIKGSPQEDMLSRMTLRSMQQARYTTDCEGHFGLALQYYCHFTSPIRRYPDLHIHRIIKEQLHGQMTQEETERLQALLPGVAQLSSERERRAAEAERETQKQKKCEYMEQRLGEVYEGKVSGVTGWGLYVELPNTVEGLVHISNLRDDYYTFDEEQYILTGERTGRTYALGDPIRVETAAVDVVARTIDFLPAETAGEQGRSSRRAHAMEQIAREQRGEADGAEDEEVIVTAQGEEAFLPEQGKKRRSKAAAGQAQGSGAEQGRNGGRRKRRRRRGKKKA